MVHDHWLHEISKGRIWTWFSLKLVTNEIHTSPVSHDHVVPNHEPTEQQGWRLSGVVQALMPANESAQSCSNPVVRLLVLKQVVQSHRVQDCEIKYRSNIEIVSNSFAWEKKLKSCRVLCGYISTNYKMILFTLFLAFFLYCKICKHWLGTQKQKILNHLIKITLVAIFQFFWARDEGRCLTFFHCKTRSALIFQHVTILKHFDNMNFPPRRFLR